MLGDILVTAAVVAAVGNVLFGVMLAWGLAGGDGTAPPAQGLLALAVLAALVVAAVTASQLLATASLVILAVGVAVVLGFAVWVLQATEDPRHRRWLAIGVAVAAPVLVLTAGTVGGAAIPSTRDVLLAGLGPAVFALAVATASDRTHAGVLDAALATLVLCTTPTLLCAALLTSG